MRAAKNRANFAQPVRSLCFAAAILVGASCTENLPNGPDTFGATIKILVAHDTIVVGDSSTAQAQTLDASGRVIQALKYTWTSAAPTIVDFATPATENIEVTEGRTKTMVGKFPGRSLVTMTLPDTRFVTTPTSRTQTVVVGGVRILSTHDSTLTAVNDTVRAIAAGLVRVNGALVTRVSQGVKWTHLGTHTATIGSGDTIRYISRSNGADTLIATHDFCLLGAKCADTAVVRVNQQVSLTLSSRTFAAWSFSDTLGPTITLADRRGNGLPNATIRFVPATAFDSLIVRVSPTFGVSNPANGAMAAPKLISTGNGLARVAVQGIGADGVTIVALDSIFETVRQVARRVQVEPLRASITAGDSIPIKPVARDARGAVIADATVTTTPTGIPLNGIWTGPIFPAGAFAATITPTLTGVALPAANPSAPQIQPTVDDAIITILPSITRIAGATQVAVTTTLLDSLGQPAFNKFLRFGSPATLPPDSVQADGAGGINFIWTPRDSAGTYTLTGVRGAATQLVTVADSAGRIAVRQSVTVIADVPSASKSTLAMSAVSIPVNGTATMTIRVNDRFGNPVKTATSASFQPPTSTAGGTFGPITCVQGVCTLTYTAPAAAGPDSVAVKILGVDIAFSPIPLTIF